MLSKNRSLNMNIICPKCERKNSLGTVFCDGCEELLLNWMRSAMAKKEVKK